MRLWMKSTMSCVEVPGRKISADADFLELGNVGFGNNAAEENGDVVHTFFMQQIHQLRADRVVCTGKNREADDVDVLLHGGGGDHLGRLTQSGVDDFHSGVAQCASDYLCAAVVAVETWLGNQYANLFFWHGLQVMATSS